MFLIYYGNQRATPEILLNKQDCSSVSLPIQGIHTLKDVLDKALFDIRELSIKLLLHINLIYKNSTMNILGEAEHFHTKLSKMGIEIYIWNAIN
jgi:hypothetical protein